VCMCATASFPQILPWVFYTPSRIIKARERMRHASCEPCRCMICPHLRALMILSYFPPELIATSPCFFVVPSSSVQSLQDPPHLHSAYYVNPASHRQNRRADSCDYRGCEQPRRIESTILPHYIAILHTIKCEQRS
jgi:hypothetical protein